MSGPLPEVSLAGAALVDDPYPFYAQLRREAPVWQVPGTDVFFVSTWALVTEAAARVDDFSNRFRHTLYRSDDGSVAVLHADEAAAGPDVFAGADPPAHSQHRRVFFPELVREKMQVLEPDVVRLADESIDRLLAADDAVDVATVLAEPLPVRLAAECVIGFGAVDVEQLRAWVLTGSRIPGGRLTRGEMADVGAAVAPMWGWVAEEVDRGEATRGTVLGAATAAVRDGVLTRDEAVFTLMVLVGAAAETTTALLGNAVRVLAERPAVQQHLREDPDLVVAFVEEVLRYESPFRFHPRTALHATELGGVAIPERALVALLWSSANRDESVFDVPDEVRLDRPNSSQHLGFGRGIHHCVGAPLARLEGRVVLTRLLARTSTIGLDPGDPAVWADSLWVRRHERLPVVVTA